MGRYKIRRIQAIFVLLVLSAVTCGVSPRLLDLIMRVERLEAASIMILDSNDQPVGTFLAATGGGARVLLEIEGGSVSFGLSGDRILAGHNIFFTSEECTGQAYSADRHVDPSILRDAANLGGLVDQRSIIGQPGHTLYVAASETVQQLPMKSLFHTSGCNDGQCGCIENNGIEFSVPIDPVVDLDTLFTPPFSLVASD